MENIIKRLDDLGKKLYEKFGTESYVERCELHDIKELIKGQILPIHNVVKPKGTVCEHTDTYYDDRNLGMVCKKCRCVIPD